ncbi:hypothetical protein ACNZ70_001703 [Vibrio mimicus]
MRNLEEEYGRFVQVIASGDLEFARECIEKLAQSLKTISELIDSILINMEENGTGTSSNSKEVILKIHNAAGNAGLMSFSKVNAKLVDYEQRFKEFGLSEELLCEARCYFSEEHDKFLRLLK